jgi:hypothetical protein
MDIPYDKIKDRDEYIELKKYFVNREKFPNSIGPSPVQTPNS